MNTAETIIKKLQLQPHPEGGYFKETYRSQGSIPQEHLAKEYQGSRNYATSIYFLLTSDTFSAFHKINQDEIWHFYDGSPILLHMISPEGNYSKVYIGKEIEKGQQPQYVVPGGYWFAAEVISEGSFAFVGCTVAPGFDFNDFDLPNREDLIEKFPQHERLIASLTHH